MSEKLNREPHLERPDDFYQVGDPVPTFRFPTTTGTAQP